MGSKYQKVISGRQFMQRNGEASLLHDAGLEGFAHDVSELPMEAFFHGESSLNGHPFNCRIGISDKSLIICEVHLDFDRFAPNDAAIGQHQLQPVQIDMAHAAFSGVPAQLPLYGITRMLAVCGNPVGLKTVKARFPIPNVPIIPMLGLPIPARSNQRIWVVCWPLKAMLTASPLLTVRLGMKSKLHELTLFKPDTSDQN